jgi:gliding motility-associated-like protein
VKNLRIYLPLLTLVLLSQPLRAQLGSNLVTYLSFEENALVDSSGFLNTLFFGGDTTFVCGAQGDGLFFDGNQHFLTMLGDISVNRFRTVNFSVSFFFKPLPGAGTYDVMSKREDCDETRAFAVTYTPQNRQLRVLVSESAENQSILTHTMPPNRCWYHVVIVRRANRVLLYIDGQLVGESISNSRVNLTNNAQLSFAAGPCIGGSQVRFRGVIDEVRVYDRDLPLADVLLLNTPIDRILTRDTIVFLGQPLTLRTSHSCAQSYSWTPITYIQDPSAKDAVAAPQTPGRYQVSFIQDGCTAIDTVFVDVIDPDELDCNDLFLPSAFTPNGDGLNEEYGISNPLAIDALDFFEIYDRWGTRVFSTTNAFERWDGNFRGQPLMPGAFMYKARYICRGDAFEKIGSFTLIR